MTEKSSVARLAAAPEAQPYDPNAAHVPINAETKTADDRTVYERLNAVMNEIKAVGKDSENKEQHFKFRGIDAVINEVKPLFTRHGLVCFSENLEISYHSVPARSGAMLSSVRVKNLHRVHGLRGDWLAAVTTGEAFDSGDKATAKANSVAYRTFLLQTLMIPTNDPDPDEQSYERGGSDQVKPKIDAENIARIAAMIETAKNVGGLNAAGLEMRKFDLDQEQTEAFYALHAVSKARLDAEAKPTEDAWTTKKPAAAPALDPEVSEKLRQAQTDMIGAADMNALLKILSANPTPDVVFPSITDGAPITLRQVFDALPLVVASRPGSAQ